MWTSLSNVALALSFTSQILSVTSIRVHPRQEQCQSAPNDAASDACSMQAAFGGSSILPELLANFAPKAALAVKYGNVVLGGAQQLSPAKVFAQPSLSMSFISDSPQAFQKQYAVMGISYQAPNSVKLFWLQSAFKVDSNTGALTSSSAPIVNYISPNPASGTGSNEYIFLAFLDPGLETLIKQNPQWASKSVSALDIKTFQSTIAPQVIAGSYFKSTFDGVPINGKTSSVLAATQKQVASVSQATSDVLTNVTDAVQGNHNQTTQASSQVPVNNVTAAAASPTQVLRPANPVPTATQSHSNSTSKETDSSSSSAVISIRQKSLKSFLAVALFSFAFC